MPHAPGADQQHKAEIRINLCGRDLVPDSSGALYWPEAESLLVADLHLEKGAAFARKGRMLPPYDTRTTLRRLAAVIGAYRPRRIIALGDSFHDCEGAAAMPGAEAEMLASLQRGREWCWITGNHDPELPKALGGTIAAELTLDGLTLRHEPTAQRGEIAGHLHPVACISRRGEAIRRKCFATDGEKLVLPAFGAYTGGLNVLGEAFAHLFDRERLAVWLMGKTTVYPIFGRALAGGA